MAGILDPKKRFLDTFVTQVGRDQLAHGELRFSFAVFSDHSTYYESSMEDPDVVSDSSNRIFFEAANRPQDQIIPEFDDDGYITFPAGDFDITNESILQVAGSTGKALSGDALIKSSSLAVADCATSFSDLDPLRSEEVLSKTTGFKMSVDDHFFEMTRTSPINESPGDGPKGSIAKALNVGSGGMLGDNSNSKVMQLSNCESLWQDRKLTHVPNFQYLPPVQKGSVRYEKLGWSDKMNENSTLRDYARLEQPEPLTIENLVPLPGFPYTMTRDPRVLSVDFSETSKENNVVCQVWEVSSGSMTKLRMIDFGEFEASYTSNTNLAPAALSWMNEKMGQHVAFVGKLKKDSLGQDTFVNLFTVVFS
tara:strand:- start:4090 stop:5184 length:1095 start_codon:yes stop_codon:yes gene_type:complete